MGTQGSLKYAVAIDPAAGRPLPTLAIDPAEILTALKYYYESRDPGPYFPMKMVTRSPVWGIPIFIRYRHQWSGGTINFVPDMDGLRGLIMGRGTIGRMTG